MRIHSSVDEKQVILVTPDDQPIGTCGKLHAHEQGLTHRAFSVFLMHHDGKHWQLLMQQRQHSKYHCPGLWSNTCCSHPEPGEETLAAARKRLQFEMNIDCPLKHLGRFHYRRDCPPHLIEDEVDHIFVGTYEGDCKPNPDEAADWRWQAWDELAEELHAHPERFTPWLGLVMEELSRKELR